MMLQLNPPIWVRTPLGDGIAHLIIDYGPALNTVWVVQLTEDGSVTHVESPEVRIRGNLMYGIPEPKRPLRGTPGPSEGQ
jgi:hypothetical protein